MAAPVAQSGHAHETAPAARVYRDMPNWLTSLRVLLAVVFFAILTPWTYTHAPGPIRPEEGGVDVWLLAAAAVFGIAAVTDALDGYLARRWGAVSAFGRIMDPFADKLLVVGAFVFLAGAGFWHPTQPPGPGALRSGIQVSGVEPWMVALILGRELLVTSIRGVLEGQGVSFPATTSGKLKMILQCITVPAVLVLLATVDVGPTPATPRPWGWWAIQALVWSTVIVTAWSGVPYIVRAIVVLRDATLRGGGAS